MLKTKAAAQILEQANTQGVTASLYVLDEKIRQFGCVSLLRIALLM
jgi:hypothetical protein